VANLGNDYDNPNDADPIDSAPPRAAILHHGSTPKERAAANRQHHDQLAAHLVSNAVDLGHGHVIGRQGERGHKMVPNDAHLQAGAYLKQGALDPQPNRQNTALAAPTSTIPAATTTEPSTSKYRRDRLAARDARPSTRSPNERSKS
jgi:hypothetical protein